MQAQERFQGLAGLYASFRPDYPPALLARLARLIQAVPAAADSLILDIGSGTGIFTRQLHAILPAMPIMGIEPSVDMRTQAMRDSPVEIAYREGLAQAIPQAAGQARAVLAATAAHWFDRPAFYAEARRVLVPGGVLAIVEYVRDDANSPAAAAVVAFLAQHGTRKPEARPDYAAELDEAEGFEGVQTHHEQVTLSLSPEQFIGLCLSSSHAKPILAARGQAGAEAAMRPIAEDLTGADGRIPFGYRFQLFATRALPQD